MVNCHLHFTTDELDNIILYIGSVLFTSLPIASTIRVALELIIIYKRFPFLVFLPPFPMMASPFKVTDKLNKIFSIPRDRDVGFVDGGVRLR